MGLLDRFKRSSSKEPSLEEKVAAEIEDFKGQLQAQADSIREDAAFNDYIAGKVEEGYRRLDERYKSKGVVAEFSKSKKETEQEFIDTHKKNNNF